MVDVFVHSIEGQRHHVYTLPEPEDIFFGFQDIAFAIGGRVDLEGILKIKNVYVMIVEYVDYPESLDDKNNWRVTFMTRPDHRQEYLEIVLDCVHEDYPYMWLEHARDARIWHVYDLTSDADAREWQRQQANLVYARIRTQMEQKRLLDATDPSTDLENAYGEWCDEEGNYVRS